MSKSKYVYVVYIATTADQVWQAITEGDIASQYWGHANVSDWKVGSKWEHRLATDPSTVRVLGKVVEANPPSRLVISWAAPADVDNPSQYSRVAFDIIPIDDMVKLTVTHDELEAGSNMEKGITEGWPRVLSSMKSFLETGKPLDIWAKK